MQICMQDTRITYYDDIKGKLNELCVLYHQNWDLLWNMKYTIWDMKITRFKGKLSCWNHKAKNDKKAEYERTFEIECQ